MKQIETVVQTFEHYMAQGYSGSDIPNKAVYPILLLVIDSSWKMALEEKGLTEDSTLEEVKVMLTGIASALYPIHARRMAFFDTKNNGSPVELARELNRKSPTAAWESFKREAAVKHMFIQLTSDLDARREASEILKTKPQVDYLLLIEKLQNLKNAPWNISRSLDIRKQTAGTKQRVKQPNQQRK